MADPSGSKTHDNLRSAFARESQTGARYIWFAQAADIDGQPDAAALFRSLADGETGHVHGALEHLADLGDPLTGEPIGDTEDNIRAALVGESRDATELYPAYAATARAEGFDEIGDWFDNLARAEQGHADRTPVREYRRGQFLVDGLGPLQPEDVETVGVERIGPDLLGDSVDERVVDVQGFDRVEYGQDQGEGDHPGDGDPSIAVSRRW